MDELSAQRPEDFATLIAAERRVQELEAEVHHWQERARWYMRATEQRHAPCQCEPAGSGNLCTGVCQIRGVVDGALQGLPWRAAVMSTFDAAVVQVRGERMS